MDVKEYVLVPSNVYERLISYKNLSETEPSPDVKLVETSEIEEIIGDKNIENKDSVDVINKTVTEIVQDDGCKHPSEVKQSDEKSTTDIINPDSLTSEKSLEQTENHDIGVMKVRKNRKNTNVSKVKKLKKTNTQFKWVSYS